MKQMMKLLLRSIKLNNNKVKTYDVQRYYIIQSEMEIRTEKKKFQMTLKSIKFKIK